VIAVLDLRIPGDVMLTLADHVTDDRLDAPTPCSEYTVRDLLTHVAQGASGFRAAARKVPVDEAALVTVGEADWRARFARELRGLADEWRAEEAWQGMTKAGPFDFPGAVAGNIAHNELVVHCWDLARATGQNLVLPTETVRTAWEWNSALEADDAAREARATMFAPPVPVAEDAPLIDRVAALTGRDPRWGIPAAG
jgi:uncharacterized protein (TIGR03086 family)